MPLSGKHHKEEKHVRLIFSIWDLWACQVCNRKTNLSRGVLWTKAFSGRIEAGSVNHFKMSRSSRKKLGGKFLRGKLSVRAGKTKISDEKTKSGSKNFWCVSPKCVLTALL